MKIKELIEKLKLDYCNPDVTEENFPIISKGKVTKLFKFDKYFTTKEALDRLDSEGYRLATVWELLNWAKDNWNGKDCVVALGQEWLVAYRGPIVVYLWSDAGRRELDLLWSDHVWFSFTLVAGVRKLDSKKLKSLDSLETSGIYGLNERVKEPEKDMEKLKKVINL